MFRPPAHTNDLEYPLVPITTSCGGLLQNTEFYYTVDAETGRRIQVEPGKATMRRRVCMKLPLLFSPEVWHRHQYSFSDVVETFNYVRSIHLWQLAVLLGIRLSSSSVKLAFSTPTSMVFSSKAIVMCKIARHLRRHYLFPRASVLDKSHEEHVPPLPVHRIPATIYQVWKQQTPTDPKTVRMLQENPIERLFAWNDIELIPLWMEGDHIYMIRVVDEATFRRSGRDCNSLATRPISFRHTGSGQLYLGLVDEAGFFLPS